MSRAKKLNFMDDNKAFSIVEVLMGAMIIGSLETAEALLDPIGMGLLLTPAELGVGTFMTLWFLYKGGSRLEARLILAVTGTAIDLIPIVGIMPTKLVVFLVAVHLANKAAEQDAEQEKNTRIKGVLRGEGENEEIEDYENSEEDIYESPEAEYSDEQQYEDEEEEFPRAA